MKAAVFHEPGVMVVQDVPIPSIAEDELLIRVRSASICGTDLRISRHGHFKIPAGEHRVQGHEVAGEVALVGRAVEGFAEGDRVSVTPNVGCGHCRFCRQGLNNMCPNYEAFGVSLDGGFAEYLRIPGFAVQRGNVFRLPDRLGFAEAALVEPFSCCLRGQEALGVGYDDTVLIVGRRPDRCVQRHAGQARRRGEDHRGQPQPAPARPDEGVRRRCADQCRPNRT